MDPQIHNYHSEDVNSDTLGPHNATSHQQNMIDHQMTHTMTGQKGVVEIKMLLECVSTYKKLLGNFT